MAYTDDWESLMNGVFGPGGRFKAGPTASADPAADAEPKAKTAGPLPDLNAALLAQQKKLDEMLKQQTAALKDQDAAARDALENSRRMLRDMEADGLLARGTADTRPEHLGSFEGLAEEVKQTVLGQDAFVESVVRAMRRPFVLGTEGAAARNVILLSGGSGTGPCCKAMPSPPSTLPSTLTPARKSSFYRTSTPPSAPPARSWSLSITRAAAPAF